MTSLDLMLSRSLLSAGDSPAAALPALCELLAPELLLPHAASIPGRSSAPAPAPRLRRVRRVSPRRLSSDTESISSPPGDSPAVIGSIIAAFGSRWKEQWLALDDASAH